MAAYYLFVIAPKRERERVLTERSVETAQAAVEAADKLLSEVAKRVQRMAEEAGKTPTAELQIAAASTVDHAREVYFNTSDVEATCETVGEIVASLTTCRANLRDALDFRKAPKARELDDALTATITRGEELQERLRRTISDHKLTAEDLKRIAGT